MRRLCMQVDGIQLSSKAFFLSFFPLFGRFVFTFSTISFTYWHVFLNSCVLLTLYGFARCCDKRISSLTLKRTNSLRVERLQRGINTKFCSNSVQSNHSGNKILINCCVIGCLPFSMDKPVAPRFRQMVRKIQDW